MPLAAAAAAAFPAGSSPPMKRAVLGHGGRLPGTGRTRPAARGPVAAFGPDGTLIALVEEKHGQARPLAVFVP